MPYSKEHREASRARIVEAARRLFNQRGFEQVSIDEIMEKAGMTRGGFYHHFKNKLEVFSEAVASFASGNPMRAHLQQLTDPLERARTLVSIYLSDEVLDAVEFQCPLYALPSDVARGGPRAQQAYSMLMRNLVQAFRCSMQGSDIDKRAHAIVALCVGGMVLARTTDDVELKRSVRAASRQQALALLG